GRELLQLLAHHPAKPHVIEIDRAHVLETASACDVVMLATPVEVSHELVPQLVDKPTRVIDLSGAFRLREAAAYTRHYAFAHAHAALLAEAVYGQPEHNRELVRTARLVANPGCYATAIQLALAPLLGGRAAERAGVAERN